MNDQDLLDRVARIIDPAAFALWEWRTGTSPDSPLAPRSDLAIAKEKYEQAAARRKAWEILKLASGVAHLREWLIEHEIDDWHDLGIDHPDLRRIVEDKYSGASLGGSGEKP